MVDQKTRYQIQQLISVVTDEVHRHFGDPAVVEPFEMPVGRGDETLEHSRLVGEGVKLGLREDLAPMVVNVKVDESGYLFKVER
ncbi:hypothetical protein [Pseudomonas sp. WS 5414]|uniref:hypothetical protein n=1 Tax=Pseudomonas sp. WS 5414 TaxID=2717478 RepID=UPI0014730B79|nr:hypothetical protein [Pseudomonas sp. WS 5414]NMY67316.1 hypothetical protein [Pseudomonas sp. WS 5414]